MGKEAWSGEEGPTIVSFSFCHLWDTEGESEIHLYTPGLGTAEREDEVEAFSNGRNDCRMGHRALHIGGMGWPGHEIG